MKFNPFKLIVFTAAFGALATHPPVAQAQGTLYSTTITNDKPLMYWSFDEPDGNAVQQMPLATAPVPVTTENDLAPNAGAVRISHASISSGLRLGQAVDLKAGGFLQTGALRVGKKTLDGAYALEFWCQSQAVNTASYLANFGSSGADNSPAVIYNFNENYFELYGGAGGRTGTNGPAVSDQNWHHLMFVYYGDGFGFSGVAARLDAYLDGVNYPNIGDTFTKAMNLGRLVVGAALPTGDNSFTGRMDEVAVYDLSSLPDEASVTDRMSAMVASHIASARAASGPSYSSVVLADTPLLYWNFDETGGTALQQVPVNLPPPADLDNTLNDLVATGAATRASHTDIGSGLQLGNAADFDGVSSFQILTGLQSPIPVLPAPWGLEMWFQFKGDQANRYLLNMGSGAYNSPAVIYGYFGPRLEVYGAGNGRSGTNGVLVSDQNWHHLLVVNYNTAPGSTAPGTNVNRIDFFIDNVQYADVGGGFNQPVDFASWLIFGAATPDNSGGLIGRLDELAIYNFNALTKVSDIETRASALAASHYAAAFGSLSVGTITITQQPANAASQIGQMASFHVAATVSGTTNSLTYQWNRNGVAIVGATNDSYTTLPLTLNDVNTNLYTVRVSAGPAFKLSNPAQLTVPAPPAGPLTAYSQQVESDAPLLYWNFDESFGPAKQLMPISVKPVTTENTLLPTGSAALRVSHSDLGDGLTKLGNALQLDGSSYMLAASTRLAQKTLTGAWAGEFWMQFSGAPGTAVNQYIANFGNPGSDNSPAFIYGFTVDKLEAYGAGGRSGTNGPTIGDNQWHHIIFVNYNDAPAGSTNTVAAYIDGTLYARIGGGFNRPVNLSSFLFGAATTGPANGFTGNLDELAVYDLSNLSSNAIASKIGTMATNHYAMARSSGGASYSAAVLADQPILYYSFDETDGNALQKAPVTLPSIDPTKNDLIPALAGRVQHQVVDNTLFLGNAADFDGKSYFQSAQLDAGPALTGPWAVEFWMQSQGVNNSERQIYLMNFGNNAPAFIYDFKPDELEIFAGAPRTDLGPTVSDNNWHHVMWVFYGDGSVGVADRVDAYLDGTAFPSVRNTFTHSLDITGGLIVGEAIPGYNGLVGRLDELAVYDLSNLAGEAAVKAKVEQMVASHRAASTNAPSTAQLVINRSAAKIVLSWNATGFILQHNDNLANSGGWTDVSGAPSSPVSIDLPATGASFYRLIKR
ncbi:MAG: hypothetical protein JWM99_1969 [Verrucomicrobiales bacterium]|nr:hypothetical protein [Verrucomicrobiales bacterium]